MEEANTSKEKLGGAMGPRSQHSGGSWGWRIAFQFKTSLDYIVESWGGAGEGGDKDVGVEKKEKNMERKVLMVVTGNIWRE